MRASNRLWTSFAKLSRKQSPMDSVRHLEGVFAVNKPPHLSSAQVLRDIQERFNPSQTFAPWLAAEKARLDAETKASGQRHQPRKKRWERKHSRVKIGHGGTLDPLAKGVLIAGIGGGTKKLSGFLGCTKTYETVVLFGVATDSYDSAGKIVKRSPSSVVELITREKVESALAKFRGEIMQRPPIYSALHIQGKRLYEYAREGIAVPVEIPERPVKVESLETIEWLDPGAHAFKPPAEEVGEEDRAVAENLLAAAETGVVPASDKPTASGAQDLNEGKRKRSPSADPSGDGKKRSKTDSGIDAATLVGAETASSELAGSTAAEDAGPIAAIAGAVASTAAAAVSTVTTSTSRPDENAATNALPAVRLRMTVSSGFYVRSLAHDLGVAVGGLAFMADLIRTRQERFELGKHNVLEYSDITERDESVWGPKVLEALKEWNEAQSTAPDDNDRQ